MPARSTTAPLLPHKTLTTSGTLAPPSSMSFARSSIESSTPFVFCVLVAVLLMPLVAYAEWPPQKDDLASKPVLPPFSRIALAADIPARPPRKPRLPNSLPSSLR